MAKPTFSELINQSGIPVLVDFYADWCGPCKMMEPVLKEVAGKLEGKMKIIKIDSDKYPQLSNQYGIRGIPTYILFKKGNILWRTSGAMPAYQFESELKKFI
jgi:thioredoxin 1